MNKQKLFLDFDGVIINSIQAYCATYNDLFQNDMNWIPADWTKCNKWDLTDICPLINNAKIIFSIPMFFKYAKETISPNTLNVIKKLCEKYRVIICTIGTWNNLALKCEFIKTQLPFVKDTILLKNDGCKMDKSIINMSGSIFIDDVVDNLVSSNADYIYVFGNEYDWNKNYPGKRLMNWDEIENTLL